MIEGISIDHETADSITIATLADSLANLYQEYKDAVEAIAANPHSDVAVENANDAAMYYNAHIAVLSYFTTEEQFREIMVEVKKID